MTSQPRDNRLSRDEAQELTERFVEVTGSGLPLADGLWAASCEVPQRKIRRVLQQMAEFIRRGGTWEQAIQTGQLPLPRYLAGLLQAGARAGHLPTVVSELADHYRSSRDVWRQLRLSLAYPITLLAFLALIITLIIALVVPEMERIFLDFDTTLPTVTAALFWVAHTGWMYFAGAMLTLVVLGLLIRLIGGQRTWLRVLSTTPGLGPLLHWQGFAEYARLLRLLLLQNVPLPEALRRTADGVQNANVAHTARRLADQVENGKSLAASMQVDSQIPGLMVPLVRTGEENGDLPSALAVIYELLEGHIQLRSRLLMVVLPPLVFLFIAIVVIAILAGLLFPLASLISNLS